MLYLFSLLQKTFWPGPDQRCVCKQEMAKYL